MSQYIEECWKRAFESIKTLKLTGKEASYLEISSDVWGFILMGGINMFSGEKIFCGLPVIELEGLSNHIQAI